MTAATEYRRKRAMWTSKHLLRIREECRHDHKKLKELRKEVCINGDGTFTVAPVLSPPDLRWASDTENETAAPETAPTINADRISFSQRGKGIGGRLQHRSDRDFTFREGETNGWAEHSQDQRVAEVTVKQGWQEESRAKSAQLEELKARVEVLEEEKASLTLSLSYMCEYKGHWGRRGGSASSFAVLEKRLQELVLDKVELERKNVRLQKKNRELRKKNNTWKQTKETLLDDDEEVKSDGNRTSHRKGGSRGFQTPLQGSPSPVMSRYSAGPSFFSPANSTPRILHSREVDDLETLLASEREKSRRLKAKLKAVSATANEDRANFMQIIREMKMKKDE